MVDIAGYTDLTQPPAKESIPGYDPKPFASAPAIDLEKGFITGSNPSAVHPEVAEIQDPEFYNEYSGNVKTLVRLVNDLPEGVTKQTGAQIIRLTMEAMGISMESVLSEAQAVQGGLLDAVRANIKKIEEYKTIIRKLESEIRFHQNKANELSEIIDLFILSNTSPNMPQVE